MICSLCSAEFKAGRSIHDGTPVCSGPVCPTCWEFKVRPARICPKGAGDMQGAWAIRVDDGIAVSSDAWYVAWCVLDGTCDPVDAVTRAEAVASHAVPGQSLDICGREAVWLSPAMLTGPASRLVPPIPVPRWGGGIYLYI